MVTAAQAVASSSAPKGVDDGVCSLTEAQKTSFGVQGAEFIAF
jgi:hypothetical protein